MVTKARWRAVRESRSWWDEYKVLLHHFVHFQLNKIFLHLVHHLCLSPRQATGKVHFSHYNSSISLLWLIESMSSVSMHACVQLSAVYYLVQLSPVILKAIFLWTVMQLEPAKCRVTLRSFREDGPKLNDWQTKYLTWRFKDSCIVNVKEAN